MSKSRHGPADGIDGLRCLVPSTRELGFGEVSEPANNHGTLYHYILHFTLHIAHHTEHLQQSVLAYTLRQRKQTQKKDSHD